MKPRQSPTKWPVVLALPSLIAALAAAPGERILSISAVMHKQYTVSRAPFKVVKKEMEARAPDWEKVRAECEKFGTLGAVLGKNKPNWGTEESWGRFVGTHLENAGVLQEAARARDLGMLRAAHKKIADSCNACHRAHRSDPDR